MSRTGVVLIAALTIRLARAICLSLRTLCGVLPMLDAHDVSQSGRTLQ